MALPDFVPGLSGVIPRPAQLSPNIGAIFYLQGA